MTADVVSLDQIRVRERDRSDLGDIAELAASIDAVGLLHPVVITADYQLVAGERRLAALAELGWTEIPVTVVDLSSAEAVLRAELEENTCRKPLTPYEASRARERRAAVLGPEAAERKRAGVKLPTPDLGEGDSEGTARKTRETAKVAALGTGYSGTTLDKVDRIREVAERGVIRRGDTTVPAPDDVRDVALAALAEVRKPGGTVDSAHRKVDEAIQRYVEEEDADARRNRLAKAWFDTLSAARKFREFDIATLDDILTADEWDASTPLVDGIAERVDAFTHLATRRIE